VLENSGETYDWKHMILLEGCTQTRVEGIVLRKHSRGWTFKAVQCDDMEISNMKIVGSHSYNDDGIDLCNSRTVRIDGCFVRTNDDAFAFKGMDDENRTNCEDITVTDCMMWSDLCCTILLGDESRANYMRNIVFRDCFVPFLSYEKYLKKFLMLHACEEMRLENVRIENIEIRGEGQNRNYIEIACEFNQWCKTKTSGYIKDVVLKNVHLTSEEGGCHVVIKGFDETHTVEDVRFENCTVNDSSLTSGSPNVQVGPFTTNISFQSSVRD
jgi:pectate lyase